jgi:hypothetical protein
MSSMACYSEDTLVTRWVREWEHRLKDTLYGCLVSLYSLHW